MDWKAAILSVLQWIESQGPEAALWIIALQALFVILVIPGPFFTMAAGFLFGMWWGLGAAVAGSTLGAAVAYGIARFAFPARSAPESERRRWVVALEKFVRGGGWTIVLSTRLIPFFPFKLSNYFFGWMRFPFRPFLLGTLVGIAPMTAVSVAAGSVASDLASLLRPGHNAAASRWPWSVAGLVLALALFAYAGYQGRKKLKEMDALNGRAQEDPAAGQALAKAQEKDANRERDTTEGSE
jgi:uncharacterized membrane protein YdjX (TVP38/TMEM64 family)